MFQQGTAVCHFRETVSEETHTVGGMAAFGVAEFLCSMRINSALSLSLSPLKIEMRSFGQINILY